MNRRTFTKTSLLGSIGAFAGIPWLSTSKTHILTLSFDDGFQDSFFKIAELYEKHKLSGCFNVIASGHKRNFKAVDQWILPDLMGDFADWNSLIKRGHEVMPHSWKHLNLRNQPLDEAQKLITRCLDYFERHLDGYDPSYAVFNFPFNASTPELEAFTMSKVRAVRTYGNSPINPIPSGDGTVRISCSSKGPDNIDTWVGQQIHDFLQKPEGGWLVLNLHGLDNEGWGPISTGFLEDLLARLVEVNFLEIMPAGKVLQRAKA